jgi:AcrR family transcriptional regulator
VRRSARTRERLVAATMAAVANGEDPTADRIAERAGVSERTIFRLFGDLPGLWKAVRAQMAADLARLLEVGPFEGDTRQRTPPIRQGRDALDRVLRAQTAEALAPELAAHAASISPAIDSLLSYESWKYLRAGRGLGPRQVANLLEAAVLRLVATAADATRARSRRTSC